MSPRVRKALGPIAVVVVAIAAVLVYVQRQDNMLARLIDRTHALGVPATFNELEIMYPAPSEGENAADVYARAFGLLEKHISRYGPEEETTFRSLAYRMIPGNGDELPEDSRLAVMTRFYDTHQDVMDLVMTASAMPDCRLHESYTGVGGADFSVGVMMSRLHFLLENQREWAQATGNAQLARNSVAAMMGLARHLLDEPFTTDHATAIHMINTAHTHAQALLRAGILNDTQLSTLADAFEIPESGAPLLCAYSGDFVNGITNINRPQFLSTQDYDDNIPATWPVVGSTIAWGQRRIELTPMLDALDWGVRLMEALDAPFPQAAVQVADLRTEFTGGDGVGIVAKDIIPTYFDGVDTYLSAVARCRLVRTACAIERYRLEEERLPESLDALVPEYLAEIPSDPSDGTALAYSTDGRTYMLTSIAERYDSTAPGTQSTTTTPTGTPLK